MTATLARPAESGLLSNIECWGDSLTAGSGSTTGPYTTYLAGRLAGRAVNNWGIGGQTAEQIAARFGGLPVRVTLSGGAFPGSSNPATLTAISTQLLSTTADTTTRRIGGTINGIPVILERTVVSSVETYKAYPIGSSNAAVRDGSIFHPWDGLNSRNAVNVFWWGRNNVGNPDTTGVPGIIDNAITTLAIPRRVIVIGVLPQLTETTGSPRFADIAATNALLLKAYGSAFVPSTPPTASEMSSINYTPTTQDQTDISNGVFPTGMHADNTHLNGAGYETIANRVAAALLALGW